MCVARGAEMSGYLQHLAARALGQATVAKPRLTPLFGDAPVDPIDAIRTAPFEAPAESLESEPTPVVERSLPRQAVLATRQTASMTETQASPAAADLPTQSLAAARDQSAPVASMPLFDLEAAVDALPPARTPERPMTARSPVVSRQLPSPPADELRHHDERPVNGDGDHRQNRSQPGATGIAATISATATDSRQPRTVRAEGLDRLDSTSDSAVVPVRGSAMGTQPVAANGAVRALNRVGELRGLSAPGVGASWPATPAAQVQEVRVVRVAAPMSSITERSGGSIATPALAARPQSRLDDAPATVNVTIGRVEVRAISPAQPTTKPPRAGSSPTSLDQYLSRSNRGARA